MTFHAQSFTNFDIKKFECNAEPGDTKTMEALLVSIFTSCETKWRLQYANIILFFLDFTVQVLGMESLAT